MGALKIVVAILAELFLIVWLMRSNKEKNMFKPKYFLNFYELVNGVFIFYVFYMLMVSQHYIYFEFSGFNLILAIAVIMQFVIVIAVETLKKKEETMAKPFLKSRYKISMGLLFLMSIVTKIKLMIEVNNFTQF